MTECKLLGVTDDIFLSRLSLISSSAPVPPFITSSTSVFVFVLFRPLSLSLCLCLSSSLYPPFSILISLPLSSVCSSSNPSPNNCLPHRFIVRSFISRLPYLSDYRSANQVSPSLHTSQQLLHRLCAVVVCPSAFCQVDMEDTSDLFLHYINVPEFIVCLHHLSSEGIDSISLFLQAYEKYNVYFTFCSLHIVGSGAHTKHLLIPPALTSDGPACALLFLDTNSAVMDGFPFLFCVLTDT